MTIDEELGLLDQQLRRLKIEYEIFFNNPAKRPPTDIEWKVLALLRKFSDGGRMNFSQRYRYNEMAQRYAIQSDLWRKKMRIREEGYRRPQDAMLSVSGVREGKEREARFPVAYGVRRKDQPAEQTADAGDQMAADVSAQPENQAAVAQSHPHHAHPERSSAHAHASREPVSVECSDAGVERDKVKSLYQALTDGQKSGGSDVLGSLDSFAAFLNKKTSDVRKQHGCSSVEYSVEFKDGQPKLKAKAKK